MKRDNFMVPTSNPRCPNPPNPPHVGSAVPVAAAGPVRKPRKLSEVTQPPQRVGPFTLRPGEPGAVVTAFGVIGQGRPLSSWLVSSLCPFGCSWRVHTFRVPVGYFPLCNDVEYCVVADRFISVIIPKALLDSAHSLLVES